MTRTLSRAPAEALGEALGAILPKGAAFACMETGDYAQDLHFDEFEAICRSVPKRRNEFSTGRLCARAAMSKLGLEPRSLPVGSRRQPVWPRGIIGSITHTDGIAAAVAMPGAPGEGIGIDLEGWAGVSAEVLRSIATPEEIALAHGHAESRLVPGIFFSAKESAFKALDGTGCRPGGLRAFELRLSPEGGEFRIVWREPSYPALPGLEGRYSVVGEYIVAIAFCRSC